MSQPYDIDSFSQYVTDDFTWRVREISDLKEVILLSGSSYSLVARKAALTLIYAHWEGHVHFVTEAYLKYIAKRKFKFSKLIPSFQAVQLTNNIREWQSQKDSIALRLKIVNAVRALDIEQFRGMPSGAVATAGNLNFDRFLNICQIMMLDADRIVSDREFLDEEVVGSRNRIAHGASAIVTDEKIQRVASFVLEIMRLFRTEVENSVVLKRYERA
ncbi:MAG: MAE_28990/MAE_18760 family HEPN-like nuclease [Xanthobacteraceae bacterium]|jgi:hypothetical protein